jgi:hypothetical protein
LLTDVRQAQDVAFRLESQMTHLREIGRIEIP